MSGRPTAEIVASLRYDDGVSTPTFGDLEDAADRLTELDAEMATMHRTVVHLCCEQVAAVNTALDQWENRLGGYAGCRECVADVAKAVGR